MHNHVTAIIIC